MDDYQIEELHMEEVQNELNIFNRRRWKILKFTYNIVRFVRKSPIMDTKLTLSLNKEIIEQAKDYAREHNVSLSFLVENYFLKIISDFKERKEVKGRIANELSGIIDLEGVDYRRDHVSYLEEKYR